jgi:NADH-quinone oxidoreductase subunit H
MMLHILTFENYAWAFAGGLALFGAIALFALVAVYAERKVSAYIQDRLGPMETGPKGVFQTLADILKLLMKENIVPAAADKWMFTLAPIIVFLSVFAGFAVIPWTRDGMIAPINTGILFITAIISLEVMGLMMAGWGSNNKYAIIGALRAVAQMISYEIPAMLAILSAVIMTGTLNLNTISIQQSIYAHPDAWGGIFQWNIFQYPHLIFSFIIFFISTLAETNRAPFDIPEAESELVAGFHTEYSGFKFALFMLAEYAGMLLLSLIMTLVFLGGWNTPFPNIGLVELAYWTGGAPGTLAGILTGVFWLLSKSLTLVLIMMWIRWTFPRVRPDQLMQLCWKVLVPSSIALIIISSLWKLAEIYL